VILGWQYLPTVKGLRKHSPVFDPFFVSSPTKVAILIYQMATASHGQPYIWPYLWDTLEATLIGTAIGVAAGAVFGLVVSNSPVLQGALNPFIALINATPRVAFIPIFVIIFGPTQATAIVTVVAVVFFLSFYTAYEGGLRVPVVLLQSASLLGATSGEAMLRVRWRYVLAWTLTTVPNALSFGLVSVVFAEVLTGQMGMGELLTNSISTVNATLTFSVVVVLGVSGVILVAIANVIEKRALHWWES
jgi:NitT/TauT family transport system permease protein